MQNFFEFTTIALLIKHQSNFGGEYEM